MPRLMNRLSPRAVVTLRAPGMHADGAGLYLRINKPGTSDGPGALCGSRQWVFIFHNPKRRELGLGSPPTVGLARAREKAQAAREALDKGGDPIADKKALRALPTFGELADEWIADRKASVKNTKSVDRWERVFRAGKGGEIKAGYVAALRPIRVDRVTTEDVISALKPIWGMGATATLARGYVEAVLDAAKARGLREGDNPARWRGHLDQLLSKPTKLARGHHEALRHEDVPVFMAALRAREGVVARVLEFTILTATRSGEALGAVWEEIDLERGVWTIPAERMKAGREHRVPLSNRALAILRTYLPVVGQPSGLIFKSGDKAVSNMGARMMLKRMKVASTVHGFRSAFRDWAGDRTTFPAELAEAALAHTLGGVEAAYRRGDALEKRRRMMAAWTDYCARPAAVEGGVRQIG